MADENRLPAVTETTATPTDNPIDRMIDISLDAMDGKTPETSNTETKVGEQAPTAKEATPSNEPKDSTSDGSNNQSQQPANKEAVKDPSQAHPPKDLTLADGTVVKGGAERRLYEQRELAKQQLSSERSRNEQTVRDLESVRAELNTLKQTTQNLHGVDPDTLRIGVRIVTDLQRDPVGTMKKLLAETVAQGHSIEGIASGVDTLAMQRLIDARMPEQTPQDSEAEILREAETVVNQFYSSHPDARPHDAVLARMMRDHPGLELETAYYELKNGFIEKGFDFSRSLQDNLTASSETNTQPQPTTPTVPMPNGRTPSGDGMQPAGEVKVAHEDTDMGDIVKQAMREAGMKV